MELNKKKNFKKGPKAKPAPVYDNFQKEIANDLLEQAYPQLKDKPMILETPNELPGYAREIALLRSLEET